MARVTLLLDFASQPTEGEHDRSSTSASSQPRTLAPPDSLIHEQFCRAAREGQHRDRLMALLAQGADMDAIDSRRLTALFYAAARGDEDNVQLLLKSGADVNSYHGRYGTPLCVAALRGHGRIVEALLRHKANSSYGGELGPPMHCACYGGDELAVRSIIDHGGDLGGLSVIPINLLRWISSANNGRVLCEKRLENKMVKRNQPRYVECTPLLLAAERCHFDLFQLFKWGLSEHFLLEHHWELVVERGPDLYRRGQDTQGPSLSSNDSLRSRSGPSYVTKASTSSGWSFVGFPRPASTEPTATLLMWAAKSLKLELIRRLLETGLKVDERDKRWRSALHYVASPFEDAVFSSANECIQVLLEAGADCNATDLRRRTPLMIAASSDHPALDPRISRRWGSELHATCVSSFLTEGTLLDDQDDSGWTALMFAVSSIDCQPDIVDLLCKHGAATGKFNRFGRTALHMAIEKSVSEDIISLLLQNGADANEMTEKVGRQRRFRPLDLALISQWFSESVVRVLLSHGADPDLKSDEGDTPRIIARHFNREQILERLVTTVNTGCSSVPSPTVTETTSSNGSWFKRLPLFATSDKLP